MIEGKIPETPKYKMKFAALWSLTDSEQADIDQKKAQTEQIKAQTAQTYIDSNVLDPSEVRKSLANEGDFDIEEVITEDDLDLPEDTFSPTEMSGTSENDDFGLEVSAKAEDEAAVKGAAILVIKDGKILCASRRSSEGICGPGGHIEDGETPEDAALREAQEEFNIVPLNLLPLGVYKSRSAAYCDSMIYFTDQYTGTPEADGAEMLNERWLSLEELKEKFLFPPFEESLNMLEDLMKNSLTQGDDKAKVTSEDGGKGSGNFGHGGRPGKQGGSSSGGLSKADRQKINDRIIGKKTSQGVEIKKISSHAFDRIGGRKISPGRIEKTLDSIDTEPGHTENTIKHHYKGGAAVVDSNTGTLVTYMWTGGNRHG